jgi:hypothetical protein
LDPAQGLIPSITSTPMKTAAAPVKVKKQPKAPKPVKERPVYHCLFCPSSSTDDLCPVFDSNAFVQSQWKGPVGAPIMAHLNCAQSTPECYFHEEGEEGAERIWIMGANDVVRDRWTKLVSGTCIPKRLL